MAGGIEGEKRYSPDCMFLSCPLNMANNLNFNRLLIIPFMNNCLIVVLNPWPGWIITTFFAEEIPAGFFAYCERSKKKHMKEEKARNSITEMMVRNFFKPECAPNGLLEMMTNWLLSR